MTDQNVHPVVEELPRFFTHFLIEWLYWAGTNPERIDYPDNKNKPYPTFNAYSGLCDNFRHWLRRNCLLSESTQVFYWHNTIVQEVEAIFENDGLNDLFPFGEAAYDKHDETGAHHTHQPRLDWVRSYIARNTTEE